MPTNELNFFLNAGLAGLFAIFAIVLFDKFIKFLDRQGDKQDAFLAVQTKIWQDFLKSLSEANNITLIRLGEAHNAALGRLADEIKNIATVVTSNRVIMERIDTTLVAHDVRVAEAIPGMIEAAKELDEARTKKERTRPKPFEGD